MHHSLAFLPTPPSLVRVHNRSIISPAFRFRACSSSPGVPGVSGVTSDVSALSIEEIATQKTKRLGASVALFRTNTSTRAVVPSGASVLLISRSKPPFEGSWTLPGGSVEDGEDIRDAALRELAEECALLECDGVRLGATHAEVLHIYDFAIHVYPALLLGEAQPRAGDDAADARFFPLDEITKIQTTPNLPHVVDRIHNSLAQFNFDLN